MKNPVITMLSFVLILSSCHVTQIKTNNSVNHNVPSGDYDKKSDTTFYLYGIMPNHSVNAGGTCKSMGGVAFVETKRSATDIILHTLVSFIPFFLIGPIVNVIWAPSTTNLYCMDSQK